MKTPKVAVITRTRNRSLLLDRAIQSVQNQTMGDFVQVILNDGGDKEIVDKLVEKHKDLIKGRVLVIHNNAQTGHSAALNKAIKSIDSEFVVVHDDDDSWDPEFLALTTDYLERSKAKGVITTVDIIEERIEGEEVIELKRGRALEPVRGVISIYDQCLANYTIPISFVYRRDVFDDIGYYNEDLEVAEDWDFTLRFLLKYDISSLMTDDALAFYHHRVESSGDNLNSIFTENGLKFDYHIKKLANHYLRKELEEGALGIGYIISSIRHQAEMMRKSTTALKEYTNETLKLELYHTASGIIETIQNRGRSKKGFNSRLSGLKSKLRSK